MDILMGPRYIYFIWTRILWVENKVKPLGTVGQSYIIRILGFVPPTSAVEGIKSVWSVCICRSVIWHAHGLDNHTDEFEGHRLKVKVANALMFSLIHVSNIVDSEFSLNDFERPKFGAPSPRKKSVKIHF